jgi:elongation factor 2
MLNCSDEGPAAMCVIHTQNVAGTGLVATGRLFSGSVKQGDSLLLVDEEKEYPVKQVSIYMGQFREAVDRVSAGNIAALSDITLARAGNTLISHDYRAKMVSFESIGYNAEPVMSVSIEPKNPGDLPKVVEALERLVIEDPNLKTEVNSDTGQQVISGMGELHLEVAVNTLKQYIKEIEIAASNPIVSYRETVTKPGKRIGSQSPNKSNKFWIRVKPIEKGIEESISQTKTKNKSNTSIKTETGNIVDADLNKNALFNATQEELFQEVKSSIVTGFRWACRTGPLCEEPIRDLQVDLVKIQIHKNSSLRSPDQVSRAVSRAIVGSCLTAGPTLLEAIYTIEIQVRTQLFGPCVNILIKRRGKVLKTEQRNGQTTIMGTIPAGETLGMASEIRSATSGYAFWQLTFSRWSRIPENIQGKIIKQLRERRGLPRELPTVHMFGEET